MDTKLWHHRLGHMSEKGMQILQKRNLLLDLKQIDLDFYEHCVYGKHKRFKFLRVDGGADTPFSSLLRGCSTSQTRII
jgi:hypothetical protein